MIAAQIAQEGHQLLQGSCSRALVDWIGSRINRSYEQIDRIRWTQGPAAVHAQLPTGHRFVPTASSLNLRAVLGEGELDGIRRVIDGSGLLTAAMKFLGERVALDLDQVWVRRQYAIARYPPHHAPHGWHQDGALGYDFRSLDARIAPHDGLLNMLTCWIALTDCGREAPGLEILARELHELLPVASLADAAVRQRFPPGAFRCPVLAAGDALLLPGGTLHRTHVTASMQHDRTSLELRFFHADAIPERLKHERFVVVRGTA